MKIHLGTSFDGPVFAPFDGERRGVLYAGEKKLLRWMEAITGRSGFPENTDYLRIELYRQSLAQWMNEQGEVFYKASFDADRFACAQVLLRRRDELRLSGWDFALQAGMPPRLGAFAGVEQIFLSKIEHPDYAVEAAGYADRFNAALNDLETVDPPLETLSIHFPESVAPPHFRRWIAWCRRKNIPVTEELPAPSAPQGTRLHALQTRLLTPEAAVPPYAEDHADIFILKARRASDLAVWAAKLLRDNRSHLRPLIVAQESALALEQSLIMESFPGMGMTSTSAARPVLQALKLAPAFLWEPVDVFKIMEFVTLPVKPVDPGLALEIARVLAQKPGLFSDNWFAAVYGYLERGETPDAARRQYEFWFERRRYSMESSAPKRDAVAIYDYLHRWAGEQLENAGASAAMPVLLEQSRRIRDLLEAIPDQRIGFLELERIVRTVYEASPIQLENAEVGRLDFVLHPGAITSASGQVMWWNCVLSDPPLPPDFWRTEERSFLQYMDIQPDQPEKEGKRRRMDKILPVLCAREKILLFAPDQIDGTETVRHPLLGEMEAFFPDFRRLIFDMDRPDDRRKAAETFVVADTAGISAEPAGRPRPEILFEPRTVDSANLWQTPTGIEQLLYYPHRWFFKDQLRLYSSNILSISGDNTLLGTLAHRFFEDLLKVPGFFEMNRDEVHEWIDNRAPDLLEREGATLLLYGREPERNTLLGRVKVAAWSLSSMLRNNGWRVSETEKILEGEFAGRPLRGQADLVLERDGEFAVVDLKWSGARRRKEMIRNGEDIQLIFYARLLPPPEVWPHTAYFIIEEGKMIARNAAAFREAVVAGSAFSDHAAAAEAVWQKIENTFAWRMQRLQKGRLELRTARTAAELEALYEGQMFDVLEMKTGDAPWDEFKTLLYYM